MNATVRSGSRTRALLVVAILVTAIATHLVDRSSGATAQLVLIEMPDLVNEMTRTTEWLNDYYASPDGLQRSSGLWIDGHPDSVGIAQWLFDAYLRARLNGATEEMARAGVVDAIRRSDEWRTKHTNAQGTR